MLHTYNPLPMLPPSMNLVHLKDSEINSKQDCFMPWLKTIPRVLWSKNLTVEQYYVLILPTFRVPTNPNNVKTLPWQPDTPKILIRSTSS